MSFSTKETVCATLALLACAGLAVEYGFLKPRRTKAEISDVLKAIHQAKKRSRTVTSTFTGGGVGIVIPAHSIDTNLLLVVAGVRYLGCSLPITIFSKELPTAAQMKQIEPLNAAFVYRNVDPIRIVAALESPYSEVVLLDPDTFLLQDPTPLMTDSTYMSTGLLLWNANPTARSTIFTGGGAAAEWIRKLIPYTRRGNVILDGTGTAQASGSILMFNKAKHPKTLAILQALIGLWADTTLGSKLGSDDELFWIAAEMSGEPYSFVGTTPGTIGYKFGNYVRGLPLLFDDRWQMLAMHDEHGKLFEDYRATDFTIWTDGYTEEPEPVPLNVKEMINWYFLSGAFRRASTG